MSLIELGYKHLVRPRIFARSANDAELAHEWGVRQLERLERSPRLFEMASGLLTYRDPVLETHVMGMGFINPLGLAGGFDKYCQLYRFAIPACGFGFMEVGGITRHEQVGNPRPRMKRSEEYHALWNYMGFNNPGADKAQKFLGRRGGMPIPIGLNVGKSKTTPLQEAPSDYCYTIERLWHYVDFIVLNPSSPNTPGLRSLQNKQALTDLVRAAKQTNATAAARFQCPRKPLGVKISPDETDEQLADIVEVCIAEAVDFVVATNTTVSRPLVNRWDIPKDRGGVSGAPLFGAASEIVKQLFKAFRGTPIKVIGVGGISNSRDLYDQILQGATLCEVYTAWPFEGPDMCKRWLRDLARYLKSDGFANVAAAVGANA